MASTRLTRAYGTGVTGNRNKWTISGWYKLDKGSVSSGERTLFSVYSNGNYFTSLAFYDDGRINFFDYYNGGINGRVRTNALQRDVNGWYHIVGVWDKDNSTSGDRIRLWVNGVRITGSLAQYETMPSNASTLNSDDQTLEVGAMNSTSYFGGIMTHLHFCDGYAYDASSFGSTDATTGEWKINTSPNVSYGTQGWFWLKDNIATTDNSPNSNTFTVSSGTLTKTESNPSNIFATLNPLASLPNTGVSTFTNGNTTSQGTNGSYVNGGSTLMMSSGKWYAEMKYVASSADSRCIVGITKDVSEISRINQDAGSNNTLYRSNNGNKNIQGSETSYGASYTTGDIIGIALDLDNNRLFFSKNGTWQDSGDPTSSTGAITGFTAPASTVNGGYFFFSGSDSNAQNNTVSWNFGNGYFGTTAVSSAGSNASGLGTFEYDVPSGYSALCTKGLNL